MNRAPHRRIVLTALAVVIIMASGCLRDDTLRDPADVPDGEDASGGNGDHRIEVLVKTSSGTPAAGVAVQGVTTDSGDAATARTDRDGRAVLHLDAGDLALFVGGETFVHECTVLSRDTATTTVTVFPRSTAGGYTGSFADPPAHAGVAAPTWDPSVVPMADHGAAWAERLAGIDVTLTWENTATAAGDLGIAIGDQEYRYWNSDYQTSLGTFTESVSADRDDLQGTLDAASAVRVGPSVSTGHYAATGIPYEIDWSMTLHERGPWPTVCEALYQDGVARA